MTTKAAINFFNVAGAIWGAIFLGIADMLLKSKRGFIAALALYAATTYPAYLAFGSANYRAIFNVWAGAAVIFTVLVSVFYYQEPMSLRKAMASALILVAMILEG